MLFAVNSVGFDSKVNFKKTASAPQVSFSGNNKKIETLSAQRLPETVAKVNIATDTTRLGANYNKKTKSIEFKLAAPNAQRVYVCLFDEPKGKDAFALLGMDKGKDGYWSTDFYYDSTKPLYYGYRLFGSNWEYDVDFFDDKGAIIRAAAGQKSLVDEQGNRYNPNKLAYDPYGKELSHIPSDNEKGHQGIYFTYDDPYSDNGRIAPKSVFSISQDAVIHKTTQRPLTDEVIGEVHIKDLSINEPVENPGTYLGAAQMAKKVKDSGITMVEFLPLNEFDDQDADGNYWGYMPLSYFAPAKKYATDKSAGGALREFRQMVDEFHKQNIKICMDVVYNHTGEGAIKDNNPQNAKALSYSLIDNQMYYKQKDGYYNSNSGCGNDFNTANEETANLIADSIAFWAKQGVDAFRFDLAAALLDTDESSTVYYDREKSLANKLASMLEERGVKVNKPNEKGDGIYLIAEPWTCSGDYSYQLGNFPDFWAEWNDKNRETIKKIAMFPKQVTPMEIKQIIEGSKGILRSPERSINYAYSHDGYTLFDSNTLKAPEGSWNTLCDFDNDRNRQLNAMKKQIALVLLSKGTPMLQIGDLIAHSKKHNPNTYNQDNDSNYLDFSKAETKGSMEKEIYDFSKKMIEFRKTHKAVTDVNAEIQYFNIYGEDIPESNLPYWNSYDQKHLGIKMGNKKPVYISISSIDEPFPVKLPPNNAGKRWVRVLDSSKNRSETLQNEFIQAPQSIAVFEEIADI